MLVLFPTSSPHLSVSLWFLVYRVLFLKLNLSSSGERKLPSQMDCHDAVVRIRAEFQDLISLWISSLCMPLLCQWSAPVMNSNMTNRDVRKRFKRSEIFIFLCWFLSILSFLWLLFTAQLRLDLSLSNNVSLLSLLFGVSLSPLCIIHINDWVARVAAFCLSCFGSFYQLACISFTIHFFTSFSLSESPSLARPSISPSLAVALSFVFLLLFLASFL